MQNAAVSLLHNLLKFITPLIKIFIIIIIFIITIILFYLFIL